MNRLARVVPLAALVIAQMAATASAATTAAAQLRAPNAAPTPVGALTRAKPAVVGMSNRLETRVDSVINAAIKDHATPGATIAVARRGKLLMLKGYGHTDWAAGAPRATDRTM